MRITCPNCKAQYEVADSVIPPGGRDVQCSACGTTWFQYPIDVALRMRAADLDDDDDDETPAPAVTPVAERRVDKTVLDVLRQEAERELTARRQDRPAVETQGDLGLPNRPRPRPADDAPPARPPRAASGVAPDGTPGRKRLLPDVDEVSTAIDTANVGRAAPADPAPAVPPPPPARSGFARGMAYVLLVGAVLIALYLFADALAGWVPALARPLAGYEALVDSLRAGLARLLGG